MKKINEIKWEMEQCGQSNFLSVCEQYRLDERKGVQNLIARHKRKWDAYQKELLRTEQMWQYERRYESYTYICGIDEAGRGPLAGPVAAGAVILPRNCSLLYINDSKQLSQAKREELYNRIMEQAVSAGVGMASPQEIDELNILQATYLAMQRAVSKLSVVPDLLLNDAVTIPKLPMKQIAIIKGDAKSISIAAASIIAKVTRDRMMCEYDKLFPEYGFASHKGYGSANHISALKTYGACPIHRKSFIHSFVKR